jgi:tetratricopeptide (TPR) repeat protein
MVGQNIPVEVALDLVPQMIDVNVDGDEKSGFRVRMRVLTAPDQRPTAFFVIREDGEYRTVESRTDAGTIGREALRRASAGELASACVWLEWARDAVTDNPGDDPLGGQPFHRLFARGQECTMDRARLAAASLFDDGPGIQDALNVLRGGREQATDEKARTLHELALAHVLLRAGNWGELATVAHSLVLAEPRSAQAFRLAVMALMRLRDWDAVVDLAEQRLRLLPDDRTAIRALSDLESWTGATPRPAASLRSLVDSGRAEAEDYNQIAWMALVADRVDAKAVEEAQRACMLTDNREYGVLHTLAALYAEVGRTSEAREVLLQAMEVSGEDDPSPHDWYVFGRIAEQYGATRAAEKAYARVTEPKKDLPPATSTFALAKRRLAAMAAAENPAPVRQ